MFLLVTPSEVVGADIDPIVPISRDTLHIGKRSGYTDRDDTETEGTESEESADEIKHWLPP